MPGGPPKYIVPTVIDCLLLALGPLDYVLTVCHFGPLSVAVSPSERCVSCCVLGGSIGLVVDFWPSLPFGGSPRGRFCTASSCFSSGSSNLLRRGHHYSWAVILADLCTGEPVDGRSVVVRIAAPHTSPSRFLESYLLEGTFSLRARWSSYISSHRSDG